jgi:hypothetical protein
MSGVSAFHQSPLARLPLAYSDPASSQVTELPILISGYLSRRAIVAAVRRTQAVQQKYFGESLQT